MIEPDQPLQAAEGGGKTIYIGDPELQIQEMYDIPVVKSYKGFHCI